MCTNSLLLVAAALLLTSSLMPPLASAISLLQMLNDTANVSQFTDMLKATGLGFQMNSGSCIDIMCFLVFAPSNTAMDNAQKSNPASFSVMDKTALVKQHYIPAFNGGTKGLLSAWSSIGPPAGEDIGFGQVQILKTTDTTLYWLAKQSGVNWSYRVNNAAIVVAESNREADNGVFHVLDQVALPIGSQIPINQFFSSPPATIANQLSVTNSLSIFNNWMTRDTVFSYLYTALKSAKVRTLFLPSDAAWARIPTSVMQSLNSSAEEYRRVLVAHFAPNIAVFTSWMSVGSTITFSTGHANIQLYNDTKMYLNSAQKAFISAGGVVAQFVDKSINYPIGDTVIHVVDRVLAFAFEDLAALAQVNAPAFYTLCSGVPSCMSLLSGIATKLTLFAPADVTSLNSIRNSNQSLFEQALMLHFVPGQISKPSMHESDLLTALNNSGQIRFRTFFNETKYYVEGRLPGRGFVRAELQMFDQPAKNGIFHKLAGALGLPVQTIQQFINSHEDLTSVSAYMGSNGFDPNLGTESLSFTVFPPNNSAMMSFSNYMSSSGIMVGSTIMKSASLRDRVFRRMVLPNQRIVADLAPQGSVQYPSANSAEGEKVTVTFNGLPGLASRTVDLTASFVIARISLSDGQYECVNGMVYPSGTVLFRDNDVEGYTRSGSTTAASAATSALGLAVLLAARL